MDIIVEATGIEAALKAVAPQKAYEILTVWYATASVYVRDEMRARAPSSLKSTVKIKLDTLRPPRWAVIRARSRLTHLIEGGTGRQGAPGFKHVPRHWPAVGNQPGKPGIMQMTGLPQAEAFLVARTIGLRGGNPARPFVRPTYVAVKGHVEQLAQQAAQEAIR